MGLAWSEAGQGAEAVGRPGSQPRIASVAPVQPQARHLHLQVSASLRGLMSPTLLFKTRDLSSHSREVLGLGFWFSLYLCPGSRCSPLWASEKGRWPAGCPVWCSCHPGMSASFLARCVRLPVCGAVPAEPPHFLAPSLMQTFLGLVRGLVPELWAPGTASQGRKEHVSPRGGALQG